MPQIKLIDGGDRKVRWLTPEQAWRMEMAGTAAAFVDDVGRRVMRLVETRHAGPGIERGDPCTITLGDMVSAACAGDAGATAHQRYEAARIRIWPEIHDARAVLTGARA